MGLDDFERELAASKSHRKRDTHGRHDQDRERRHHHHHHHRSQGDRDEGHDQRHQSRRKRHPDRHEGGEERKRRKRDRGSSRKRVEGKPSLDVKVFDTDNDDDDDGASEWAEKNVTTTPQEENGMDQRGLDHQGVKVQRDAWMQEPSAWSVDYMESRKPKAAKGKFVGARDDPQIKQHESEPNEHLADLEKDLDSESEENTVQMDVQHEQAQHDVSYTFGDSGSSWRMTKLRAVYRRAKETGKSQEDVALEQYGNLRDFDDAREEEREMDRRKMYGKEYVGRDKPSGELFQERKQKAGARRDHSQPELTTHEKAVRQSEPLPEGAPSPTTMSLDAAALNRLKARMMRAKLQKAPNAAQLEEEYNNSAKASVASLSQSNVVVLGEMEARSLAGGRSGEVVAVSGKRGRERGLVVENEDMSVDDMVRQEKRSRGMRGGEGRAFAERIARDTKFVDDLDYMDDNATKLSKKVVKSDTNLRNTAIGDFERMQRILDTCPLCHREDSDQPPIAPVISLGTRTYMTLPTEPEISKNGAVIVPIQHRLNLLECDDDEWEEIRNFMKSLTRYYDAQDKSVIFYENAAYMNSRKGHAALNAIPLPHHLAENSPAYFKEAVLASDEQWSQHKPIIDTLALVQRPGYGKAAFRKSMVREMPYFHVFFTLDGGMGHVIEDERRWPRGDLFAREIIGGMLGKGPEVIKKQGRWERPDQRVEGFRKKWDKFDWTKILLDAQ